MPATVKVQVTRARDLPIMDKSSELTDAFAEVCLLVCMSVTPIQLKPSLCVLTDFSIYESVRLHQILQGSYKLKIVGSVTVGTIINIPFF